MPITRLLLRDLNAVWTRTTRHFYPQLTPRCTAITYSTAGLSSLHHLLIIDSRSKKAPTSLALVPPHAPNFAGKVRATTRLWPNIKITYVLTDVSRFRSALDLISLMSTDAVRKPEQIPLIILLRAWALRTNYCTCGWGQFLAPIPQWRCLMRKFYFILKGWTSVFVLRAGGSTRERRAELRQFYLL